jgi:hypothetical protein
MDWMQQFDDYCERTDFAFWSEPLNAVTNLAFLIAAIVMWRRTQGLWMGRLLSFLVGVISLGSFFNHTFATVWASAADTTPIAVFILAVLFATNFHVVGMKPWLAALATLCFFPFAALVLPVLGRIPFVEISGFYWTVPILLVGYGLFLRGRAGTTAKGYFFCAGLLSLSIIVRSLDMILCEIWPHGTHFLWHVINGVMLASMIEVYRRHLLAAAGPER